MDALPAPAPAVVSVAVFAVAFVLGLLGIGVAVGFIVFNIKFRRCRVVKMASPRLNTLILAGCVLGYTAAFLHPVDAFVLLTPDAVNTACRFRTWLLCYGFSMAYGGLLTKAWRVQRIFQSSPTQRVVLRDHLLAALVAGLLLVDTVVLAAWSGVHPLAVTATTHATYEAAASEGTPSLLSAVTTYSCTSEQGGAVFWQLGLAGYKLALALYGAHLAWSVRAVTLPAINDSTPIIVTTLTVVLGGSFVYALNYHLAEWPSATCALTTFIIWLSFTLLQGLLCVPKIQQWRKFSEEEVQKMSMASQVVYPTNQNLADVKSDPTNIVAENEKLRTSLIEKEQTIKSLKEHVKRAKSKLVELMMEPRDSNHNVRDSGIHIYYNKGNVYCATSGVAGASSGTAVQTTAAETSSGKASDNEPITESTVDGSVDDNDSFARPDIIEMIGDEDITKPSHVTSGLHRACSSDRCSERGESRNTNSVLENMCGRTPDEERPGAFKYVPSRPHSSSKRDRSVSIASLSAIVTEENGLVPVGEDGQISHPGLVQHKVHLHAHSLALQAPSSVATHLRDSYFQKRPSVKQSANPVNRSILRHQRSQKKTKRKKRRVISSDVYEISDGRKVFKRRFLPSVAQNDGGCGVPDDGGDSINGEYEYSNCNCQDTRGGTVNICAQYGHSRDTCTCQNCTDHTCWQSNSNPRSVRNSLSDIAEDLKNAELMSQILEDRLSAGDRFHGNDLPRTDLEESIIHSYDLDRDPDTISYVSNCVSSVGSLGAGRGFTRSASFTSLGHCSLGSRRSSLESVSTVGNDQYYPWAGAEERAKGKISSRFRQYLRQRASDRGSVVNNRREQQKADDMESVNNKEELKITDQGRKDAADVQDVTKEGTFV